ncbi:Pancreatic triacylglycerol lipase [Nymphon striatum]|nr:Pancreatic triacylglycerol lipase [Nymphon striatum]
MRHTLTECRSLPAFDLKYFVLLKFHRRNVILYVLIISVLWLYVFLSVTTLLYFCIPISDLTVCYKGLGCFSTGGDFYSPTERPINLLPFSPKVINTSFILHTRSHGAEYLKFNDTRGIFNSNFDANKKTKFIIHGFLDNGLLPWVKRLAKEFLTYGDYNVIAVNWAGGSGPTYTEATANTRVVGAVIAQFITYLRAEFHLAFENVHLIGHSLGAHVAGYAGERINKISRISGLDPAEPYYDGMPRSVRLDTTDAKFVDIIHTDDSSILGIVRVSELQSIATGVTTLVNSIRDENANTEKRRMDRELLRDHTSTVHKCDGLIPSEVREWLDECGMAIRALEDVPGGAAHIAAWTTLGPLHREIEHFLNGQDRNAVTWSTIRQHIVVAFVSPNEFERLKCELDAIRQKPGESIYTFNRRFRELAARAYPTPSEDAERTKLRSYITSLDNRTLSRKIVLNRHATTATEAIRYVEEQSSRMELLATMNIEEHSEPMEIGEVTDPLKKCLDKYQPSLNARVRVNQLERRQPHDAPSRQRPQRDRDKTRTPIDVLTLAICIYLSQAKPRMLPLKNGVLVSRQTPVKLVKAEWTVVVSISPPRLPQAFHEQVLSLEVAVNASIVSKVIQPEDVSSWFYRLQHLRSRTRTAELDLITRVRTRRGILDFIGNAIGPIVGLASANDINGIRRAMRTSQSALTKVVHFSNQLATGIQHAFDEISIDRTRLNEIARTVANITNKINLISDKIYSAELGLQRTNILVRLNHVIDTLEVNLQTYLESQSEYRRQTASIELGRFTKEVYPISELRKIRRFLPVGTSLINPLSWYYRNVIIRPLWTDSDSTRILEYAATLPLVDDGAYMEYELRSWAVPMKEKHHFFQVDLSRNHIGLNTRTGWYFLPVNCLGLRPRVCQGDAWMDPSHLPCINSLLSNLTDNTCKIKLFASNVTSSRIEAISHGELILQTFGESIFSHCDGRTTVKYDLPSGIHLLNPNGCSISGKGWQFSRILTIRKTIQFSDDFVSVPMIDIPKILNESKMIDHLKAMPWETLDKVKFVPLEPLEDVQITDFASASVYDILGSISFAIIIFFLCAMLGFLCCKRNLIRHVFKKPDKPATTFYFKNSDSAIKTASEICFADTPRANTDS